MTPDTSFYSSIDGALALSFKAPSQDEWNRGQPYRFGALALHYIASLSNTFLKVL